jgi:hypothetical protein
MSGTDQHLGAARWPIRAPNRRISVLTHAGLAPAEGLEHDGEIYLIALIVGTDLYLACLLGGRSHPHGKTVSRSKSGELNCWLNSALITSSLYS